MSRFESGSSARPDPRQWQIPDGGPEFEWHPASVDDHEARRDVLRLLPATRRAPEQPFPGGVDDQELADLQRRLGTALPEALVDWLRVCKGESICAGGVFGARADNQLLDMATYWAMFPQWRKFGWLPVAGDGSGWQGK